MSNPKLIEVGTLIPARASTIFKLLSDARLFATWMGEGSWIDLEQGGEILVRYPSGDWGGGVVLAVVTDRRIVFSWGYEGTKNGLPPGSTRVTLELLEQAEGTAVTLLQEGLKSADLEDQSAAWSFSLGNLSAKAAELQLLLDSGLHQTAAETRFGHPEV